MSGNIALYGTIDMELIAVVILFIMYHIPATSGPIIKDKIMGPEFVYKADTIWEIKIFTCDLPSEINRPKFKNDVLIFSEKYLDFISSSKSENKDVVNNGKESNKDTK